MNPFLKTTLKWTGIAVGSLLILLLVATTVLDWNFLKRSIERTASAHSGRTVKITGPIRAHLWSKTPTLSIQGLTLDNPPWESSRPMATVKALTVSVRLSSLLKGAIVLSRVIIREPQIYLHRESGGRANWTFEITRPTNGPSGEPHHFPAIQNLIVDNGTLRVVDEIRQLTFDAQVFAHEKASQSEPEPFRVEGHGTLNDKPFDMHIAGGALIAVEPRTPYPFDLVIQAGDIYATASGVVSKPFDLAALDFDVSIAGKDLADLYYLTQLALPNTPPYDVQASIERRGNQVMVPQLSGKVGQSDVEGELTVDVSRKRPRVIGQLTSRKLALKDLGASLGATVQMQAPTSRRSQDNRHTGRPPANQTLRLFPDSPLQVQRLRGMDAQVHYRAEAIDAGRIPFKDAAFDIRLDQGVLMLEPFSLELPQGRLSGTAHIDARGPEPQTQLDVRLRDVRLDQFKGKESDATPAVLGMLQARARLTGRGKSVHDFVSNAQGAVTAVIPRGEIRAALAELTGIDVARGLGLLMKGGADRMEIRCALAQFGVQDGVMRAERMVVDTSEVRIDGSGEIRLGPEELNLSVRGQPKKLRLVRLKTPIEIDGHLRKPSLGIDLGKTAKQGAIAAALGVVAAPFAAIAAFIDPGLAKDANCAALMLQSNTGIDARAK